VASNEKSTRRRGGRKTRYEALAATKAGRRWLEEHPECQDAHVLANLVRKWEHVLCDRALSNDRRASIAARVRRAWNGLDNFDPLSPADCRAAMRRALDVAVEARAHTSDPIGPRNAALLMLQDLFGPKCSPPTAILDAAIDAWARKRKAWPQIHELARALRCAPSTPNVLRVEMSKMSKKA
jgi:hypothetical protein